MRASSACVHGRTADIGDPPGGFAVDEFDEPRVTSRVSIGWNRTSRSVHSSAVPDSQA
jgi:hypothetical protein